ncbi:hypothetical protein RRG08_003861 [Elysia crispata]|uniref:Dermatopontin n=1 Tax=Elysia crispata TaxID=231223 RepID=A0AAE0ZE38_9GAST|nr:hypothetical protein RRG08_003861 [Elysia crispata]
MELLALSAVLAVMPAFSLGLHTHLVFDSDNLGPGSFFKECPLGEVVSKVYSEHDNDGEDRIPHIDCRPAPLGWNPETCSWTNGFENDWDKPLSYTCPTNWALAGVASLFSNNYDDRIFRFQCCEFKGLKTSECEMTDYLNDWEGVLDYTAPNGTVIAGWFSEHMDGYEDRRHKLLECLFSE